MATGRWVHDLGAWDSVQAYTGEQPGWAHAARAAGAHSVSVGKLHYRQVEDDFGWTESIRPMHIVGRKPAQIVFGNRSGHPCDLG